MYMMYMVFFEFVHRRAHFLFPAMKETLKKAKPLFIYPCITIQMCNVYTLNYLYKNRYEYIRVHMCVLTNKQTCICIQ